jgi:hypothetical protein
VIEVGEFWVIVDIRNPIAKGLPNAPITFEPFTPGQRWMGIFASLKGCAGEH